MHKSKKRPPGKVLAFFLVGVFEDLYTAPAVSEMKQSEIELRAQLVQASAGKVLAFFLVGVFEDLYTAPAVSEMKQSEIELRAQLVNKSYMKQNHCSYI